MKIIAIRYGSKQAHTVNQQWLKAIGVRKSYSFCMLSSKRVLRHKSLCQLLGLLHSVFLPKAKVYVLTSTGCAAAIILKKWLFKSKVLAINSDTFYRRLSGTKGLERKYLLWLVKQIDGVISTSDMMHDLVSPYTSSPSKVVYPYCDVKKYSKIKPDYVSPNICAIGIGVNTKGTDILLKAFEKYNKKVPEATLYVCGNTASLKGLSIPKNVEFPGIVNPAKYLAKSSIYVNASRHDSFGVSILEAMSAGLPVIVTENCGAKEWVKKADPWMITKGNPSSIAKKMLAIHKDSAIRMRLGKKGRQVAKTCTEASSVRSFKKAFSELQHEH